MVSLYPCKSTLARWAEEQLYLDARFVSAHQLWSRLESDLHALVAYGFVTSLDAEATLGERLRVAGLRRTKPAQVDGKYVAGGRRLVGVTLAAAFRAALVGAFGALMRPVAVLVVAGILIWYGHRDWLGIITGK